MNQVAQKRNRLMPWYIGLAIVLVTVIFVPGTTAKFQELAEIKENQGIPPATAMLRALIIDNETTTRSIRVALSTAQAAGDEATAGLLADRLAYHEKQLWMMKSMAAS